MADTAAPDAPIGAINSAKYRVSGAGVGRLAQSWLTALATDYDALIYPDGVLIVRGLGWKDLSDYRMERQLLGRSPKEMIVARIKRASEIPEERLLTADRQNRMVQTNEIVFARLKLISAWGGWSRLIIHTANREQLKLTWLEIQRFNYGDYSDVARGLASVLGDRLEVRVGGKRIF